MELLKGKSVKGFFNKQKDDPLFLEKQKKTRNLLLKNLSRAVKEVQLLFTRTQDGVVGDCRPVQRLCARFEDVLRNELKLGWTGKVPTFWPVVLKISRKQAIEYINRLQYAQTDNGRCRAWIRLAANECSLESYITVLCQDSNLLNQYYEAHSFLRDDETVSAMKQLLAGVSQISFNITVNTASLEFAAAPEALQPPLRIRAPLPMENHSGGDVSGPSSTGTPQASSSDSSSWRSNSSGSSSPYIGNRDKSRLETNVEVVEMGDGLEASIRQEDDSFVIEAPGLDKVNAFSNLKRFSLAMEDTNEDWLVHDKKDTIEDELKSSEGIFMRFKESQEATSICTRDESVPQDDLPEIRESSPPEAPPTPMTLPTSNNPANLLTRPSSNTPSPVRSRSPSQQPLPGDSPVPSPRLPDSSPQQRSPSHSPRPPSQQDNKETQNSPNKTTPTINEESSSPINDKSPKEEKRQSVEEVPEEYSFNEILRLATGIQSSSSSRSISVGREEVTNKRNTDSIGHTIESDLIDPYLAINEDHATPKIEVSSSNPFLSSPTTPVANGTNPFSDGYNNSPSPSPIPVIATGGDQFGAVSDFGNVSGNDAGIESAVFSSSSNNPFGDRNDLSSRNDLSHDSLNPFDQPDTSSPKSSEGNKQQLLINDSDQGLPRSKETSPSPNLTLSSNLSLSVEELAKIVDNHYPHELSVEEIDVKVSKLKVYLLNNDSSNADLQQALIQLQLLKRAKLDAEEEESLREGEVIFGHTFQEVRRGIKGKKCDICSKPIFSLLKKSYQCALCGQLSHAKCLSSVSRKCVSQTLKDQSSYVMDIRPENGLTHQFFRCDCCNKALNTSVEVRLCDYTGLYYCPECHHNDLSIIPARILHNWDFDQRVVCCGCAELLSALETRPLVNIHSINPSLYKYIPDIMGVETLRGEILQMKSLLVECDRAKEEKLIQELDPWPHFKDTANMYSVNDLVGLQNGTLLPKVETVHKLYYSHTNGECEKCFSHAKMCAVCKSLEKLFKFSKDATRCQKCSSVFHKNCFPVTNNCPVCAAKNRKSRFSTVFH